MIKYNLDNTVQEGELQNLLINSQFSLWTNGTLENVGSALLTGDDSNFNTIGNWTAGTNVTASGTLAFAASPDNTKHLALSSFTEGKLYKFTIDCSSYTSGTMSIQARPSGGATVIESTTIFIPKVGETYSLIWEAAGTEDEIWLACQSSSTMALDNATLYEVTPGCVGNNPLACDGWVKDGTNNIYRQHNDAAYTKDGSFYSVKMISTAANDYLGWTTEANNSVLLQRFAGRTVTFGAWVWASDANEGRIMITDDGWSSSEIATHDGSSSWKWLEITLEVSTSPTEVALRFSPNSGGVTWYGSQPMFVFGSSIGEGNYSQKPTEPPTLTGLESLEKAHGKAFVWDKDQGMVADNRPLQNLLTNSGFEIWSNSTLLAQDTATVPCTANVCIGRGLAPDNCCTTPTADTETDVTTGWTNNNFNTFSSDTETSEPDGTYSLHVSANADDQYCKLTSAIVTEVGKLYEVNVVYKVANGDTGGSAFKINFGTSDGGTQYGSALDLFSTSWTTNTKVFKATTTSFYMRIQEDGADNDCNVYIDQFSFHEVTPGCVAADALACDRWSRSHTDGSVIRSQNIKHGCNYGIKLTGGAETARYLWQTFDKRMEEFWGRQVTFGAWIKSSSSSISLSLMCDTGYISSNAYSGSDDWEWIEVTREIPLNALWFRIGIYTGTTATHYICQPILVFGSSIGEGNYSKPTNEIIWIDNGNNIGYTEDNKSTSAGREIYNPEIISLGKISNNCKAIYCRVWMHDDDSFMQTSGCNTDLYGGPDSDIIMVRVQCAGLTDDAYHDGNGWVSCTTDGIFKFYVDASGDSTARYRIDMKGVQL